MSDERPDEWPESGENVGDDANDPYSEGYDTDFDSDADIHNPDREGETSSGSFRELGHKLAHAQDVADLVATIRQYGWTVPIVGLLFYGIFQGVFEYLTEPFAMSQQYVFIGWELALAINLVYGFFVGVLSWFLYFGVIGSISGFFSSETKMETAIFKIGGYLMLLFVPILVVASVLAVTISPPDVAIAGVDPVEDVARTHEQVADTPQMWIINVLQAIGWVVIGFLMIPVVSELYEIDTKGSVLSVLPVTLIAVIATQLF